MGSGRSVKLWKKEKSAQDRRRLVSISNEAKRRNIGSSGGFDGKAGGSGHQDIYNDTKLSRTQPWRLRYPTPRDLKEQLLRSSVSDDGA